LLFFRLFFDYRTALSIFFVRPLCSKSQSITQNEITGELGAILCDCRARIFHKQNVKALNSKFQVIIAYVLADSSWIKGQWIGHRGQRALRSGTYSLTPSIPMRGHPLTVTPTGKALPIAYVGKGLPTPIPIPSYSENVPTITGSQNFLPNSAPNSECSTLVSVRGGTILIPGAGGVLPVPGSKGALMIPGCISIANFQNRDGVIDSSADVSIDGSSKLGVRDPGDQKPGKSKYEIIDLRNS